jgi:hypothetical protein
VDLVSRQLGHASTAFTADQYVHPADEERQAAAALFGHAIAGT